MYSVVCEALVVVGSCQHALYELARDNVAGFVVRCIELQHFRL